MDPSEHTLLATVALACGAGGFIAFDAMLVRMRAKSTVAGRVRFVKIWRIASPLLALLGVVVGALAWKAGAPLLWVAGGIFLAVSILSHRALYRASAGLVRCPRQRCGWIGGEGVPASSPIFGPYQACPECFEEVEEL